MNNFQTILVAIFLSFFVFGVLLFSGVLKIGGDKNTTNGITGKVVVWGLLPSSEVSDLLKSLGDAKGTFNVDYVEKSKDTFQSDLIESFAKDLGPDLIILPQDMILKNTGFIYPIPYTSFSKSTFASSFIDGADILLSKDGLFGYPLLVDPLVFYYNKNMLSNQGILYPPSYWDELFNLDTKLIKKNTDGTIKEGMIALGQYNNVNHAKDILSMLLLQSNNPIVGNGDTSGYYSTIKDIGPGGASVGEAVVNFFLEFSNPSNSSYSWNSLLPSSFDMFTSDRLAFYVGYASELFKIKEVNPNLSYNVAVVPQTKGVNIKRTYGEMYSVVVSKKSKNLDSAFGVANLMIGQDFLKELSIRTSLPTASRPLLASKPDEAYMQTFFDSTIIAHSWLDPDNKATDAIFKELINNSLTNKFSTSEAVNKASGQMDLLVANDQKL